MSSQPTPDLGDHADSIAQQPLVDAHASSRTTVYLRELWHRRNYAVYVARSELRHRQITTVLGNVWHFLNPALSISIFYIIFGLILEVDRGVDNFLLFLTVGLFTFQFTQKSVTLGSTSVISNRGLVQAIRFPRALLPITTTLTESLAAIPNLAVIYGVALLLGEPIRWTWVLLPLIGVWQMVFNLGAAMVAARITTHFRDMSQLLPFFFRLLLWASGVIFSVESYVASAKGELLFALNPMYGFISIARWAVMGMAITDGVIISVTAWTLVLLVGGFFWFKSAEHSYHRV